MPNERELRELITGSRLERREESWEVVPAGHTHWFNGKEWRDGDLGHSHEDWVQLERLYLRERVPHDGL